MIIVVEGPSAAGKTSWAARWLARGSWTRFEIGVERTLGALQRHAVGMADVVLCNVPDDVTLERQRNDDPTRRRSNFALHRRFGPLLRDWYAALDALDPGRVHWSFPNTLPIERRRERYDSALFDAWMRQLPRDLVDDPPR